MVVLGHAGCRCGREHWSVASPLATEWVGVRRAADVPRLLGSANKKERVIGIEPTTFSLGIRSGENGACEGDGGLGRASEGEESVCDDAGSASCDEDEDT